MNQQGQESWFDFSLFYTYFYNIGQAGFTCLCATSLVAEDTFPNLRMLQIAFINENSWEAWGFLEMSPETLGC